MHEPDDEAFITLIHRLDQGQISSPQFADGIETLIRGIDQQVNVSQINGYLIEIIYERFPDAAYIFTIRDAGSWVRSFVNHQLTLPLPSNSAWQKFRDIRFRPEENAHSQDDKPLQARGLYSLDAYLGYWKRHNEKVIKTLREIDFLILPTSWISSSVKEITAFSGLEIADVPVSESHAFAGKYIESPIDELDPGYVEDRIDQYTNDLQWIAQSYLPKTKFELIVSAICQT